MQSLIRYETPTVTLSDLLDELAGNSLFNRTGREITGTVWPHVDIVEGEKEYTLRADLPGVAKEDIKVAVEKGVLTISGDKKVERSDVKKDTFYHFERTYGSFARSFSLPDHVDENAIEAQYRDGVLMLTMKKTPQAAPRSVEVKIM